MPNVGCSKRALPLLVIATQSLTACATAPSRSSVVCPPVEAHDRAFRRGLLMKSSAHRPTRRSNRRCWTMRGCAIRRGLVRETLKSGERCRQIGLPALARQGRKRSNSAEGHSACSAQDQAKEVLFEPFGAHPLRRSPLQHSFRRHRSRDSGHGNRLRLRVLSKQRGQTTCRPAARRESICGPHAR